MKASQNAYDIIKKYEGLRLEAYRCPAGVLTIGYGHTKGVTEGMKISSEQADIYLVTDITGAEKYLDSLALSLNQNQFDALVSLIFNIGSGNFSRSTLLCKLKVNPLDPTIGDEFMRWVYAGGHILRGLQKRRADEVRLYIK